MIAKHREFKIAMPENDAKSEKDARRFRLPKLFAGDEDAEKHAEAKAEAVAARAHVLGVTLPAAAPSDVVARANQSYEGSPRAHVLAADDLQGIGDSLDYASQGAATAATPEELEDVSARIDDLHALLAEINDRGMAQDKVFNTLHNELQDYKNDFIYEHLKPVVRPLLFLFDSMEQFDGEMHSIEQKLAPDAPINGAPPAIVCENVRFFREQLVEALRICEVTPMTAPEGRYDARLHKPVGTENVTADKDGEIQRVVRSGWFLNGRVFRPAEVIVGKAPDEPESGGVPS